MYVCARCLCDSALRLLCQCANSRKRYTLPAVVRPEFTVRLVVRLVSTVASSLDAVITRGLDAVVPSEDAGFLIVCYEKAESLRVLLLSHHLLYLDEHKEVSNHTYLTKRDT